MSTPFDIPIIPPSGGGGGGLYSITQTADAVVYTDPGLDDGTHMSILDLTITPTSDTQQIYLTSTINGEWGGVAGAVWLGGIVLKRKIGSASAVALFPDSPDPAPKSLQLKTNGLFMISYPNDISTTSESATFSYVDIPGTTSEVTYQVFVFNRNESADFYLNRNVSDDNNNLNKRMVSSLFAQGL
tara:strand:+ start:48 stop:605 length:558 start_codon:yes stop_codon:yes gene_type:complete